MARSRFNVTNVHLSADSLQSRPYLTWEAPGERCHVWSKLSLDYIVIPGLLREDIFEDTIYVNPPDDVDVQSPRWFSTRKRSRTAKANARLFAFVLEQAHRTNASNNLRTKLETERREALARTQQVRAYNRVLEAAPLLLEALVNQTNWFKATMLPLMDEQEQRIWAAEIGEPSDKAIKAATEDV